MTFEFSTAGRVIFGTGKRKELPGVLKEYRAGRVFCVSGASTERAQPILDLIEASGAEYQIFPVAHEPDLALIQEGMARLAEFQPDAIVAVGGGSVIDAAKAFAALEANPGDLIDYLEVIGAGKPLENPVRLPVIAMPTTSGTGSEVTRNSVIASPEHKVKVSLRSRTMIPAVALLDPELTLGAPLSVTGASGMDALVQLIEPFVSVAATPMTDALCRQGLALGAPSLPRLADDPDDLHARSDMAFASLLGGMALTNAKLGAVHGFAGVIGGMFDAPHGAICARLLPSVIEMNLAALRERQSNDRALGRYDQAAMLIIGRAGAKADELVDWAWGLNERLEISPLSQYGVIPKDMPEIVEKSAKSSSMKGNPITLTNDELKAILEQSL